METGAYINIGELDVETLNALIDKGDRFYVTYDESPPFDDSVWTTDNAFWSD